MTEEKLLIAMAEALRFSDRAKKLHRQMKAKSVSSWEPCKERSAVRRSSIDLTRALADLRKTGIE